MGADVKNEPFLGIFDTANPGQGGHRDWRFHQRDVNESADLMFKKIEAVVNSLRDRHSVLLTCIELDAEAGKFPDALSAFFGDAAWDYTTRFYVAPIRKLDKQPTYCVGSLVFELAAMGQLRRILTHNEGIRWGAALRVGGLEISEEDVADAIQGSPFDARHAKLLEGVARFAWAASTNLDGLSVWLSSVIDTALLEASSL